MENKLNFVYQYIINRDNEDLDTFLIESHDQGICDSYDKCIIAIKKALEMNSFDEDTVITIIQHNLNPLDYAKIPPVDIIEKDNFDSIVPQYCTKIIYYLNENLDEKRKSYMFYGKEEPSNTDKKYLWIDMFDINDRVEIWYKNNEFVNAQIIAMPDKINNNLPYWEPYIVVNINGFMKWVDFEEIRTIQSNGKYVLSDKE